MTRTLFFYKYISVDGWLAQLGEHRPYKAVVTGSIPVPPTINKNSPLFYLTSIPIDIPHFQNKKIMYTSSNFKFHENIDISYQKEILKDSSISAIKANYKKKLLSLKNELAENSKRKIRVCFLVHLDSTWAYKSLFFAMKEDEQFEPFIVVTPFHLQHMVADDHLAKTWQYCTKTCGVEFCFPGVKFTNEKDELIDLKEFSPDIVFYSSLYLAPIHSLEQVSTFALTCYSAYCSGYCKLSMRAVLFRLYCLWKLYVDFDITKDFYIENNYILPQNIFPIGSQKIDEYSIKEKPTLTKPCIIYAPHHSVYTEKSKHTLTDYISSTFHWNGKYILEYAKMHPEFDWVYRPHPVLIKSIVSSEFMSLEEYMLYLAEWEKIGTVENGGDFIDTFLKSTCLITDSYSFLAEYFPTENPVIHLWHTDTKKNNYTTLIENIIPHYYRADSLDTLQHFLKLVLEKNKDPMKEKRLDLIEKLQLGKNLAAPNIINNLKKNLNLS